MQSFGRNSPNFFAGSSAHHMLQRLLPSSVQAKSNGVEVSTGEQSMLRKDT